MRASPAADFLLQTRWSAGDGRRVARLFHQALVDQLLAGRDHVADHAALVRALTAAASAGESPVAVAYVQMYLAEHAARCNELRGLLHNAWWLLYSDVTRLVPLLRDDEGHSDAIAQVVRHSAERAARVTGRERAQIFALSALHLRFSQLHAFYSQWCPTVRPQWVTGRRVLEGGPLGHHASDTDIVRKVAYGRLANGQGLVACAGYAGTIVLRDPATGSIVTALPGHVEEITAVAFGHLGDGRTALASAGTERGHAEVRLWDPARGVLLATLSSRGTKMTMVAFGRLANGHSLLAGAGGGSSTRLWNLDQGIEIGILPHRPDPEALRTHDPLSWRAYSPLRPGSGRPRQEPRHSNGSTAMTFGHFGNGRAVLATAEIDGSLRLWDPEKCLEITMLVPPIYSGYAVHRDGTVVQHFHAGVSVVAFGRLADGRPILASASRDKVQLWDTDRGRTYSVLTGPTEPVLMMTLADLPDGRSVLACACADRTVWLWDATRATPIATVHLLAVPESLAISGARLAVAAGGALCLFDLASPPG